MPLLRMALDTSPFLQHCDVIMNSLPSRIAALHADMIPTTLYQYRPHSMFCLITALYVSSMACLLCDWHMMQV